MQALRWPCLHYPSHRPADRRRSVPRSEGVSIARKGKTSDDPFRFPRQHRPFFPFFPPSRGARRSNHSASGMCFDAQTREDALSQYTRLSHSHDPNDKLLALGGLLQFLRDADHSFLVRCAQATDYQFLEKLMRSGTPVVIVGTDVGDVKMENGMDGDTAQLSQLGCAVIGVFAKLDEMKGQDEVVQRIPTLIAVLQQQYENPFL